MGFLASLFGKGSDNYSREEWTISHDRIKDLVSRTGVTSLEKHEEHAVEKALMAVKKGGIRLSLYTIDRTLATLERAREISIYDRQALMKIFQKEIESLKARKKK